MDEMRAKFEEKVFLRRFLGSIVKSDRQMMPFVSVGCPTKEEFLKRTDSGDYADVIVSAMWWAWKAALGREEETP